MAQPGQEAGAASLALLCGMCSTQGPQCMRQRALLWWSALWIGSPGADAAVPLTTCPRSAPWCRMFETFSFLPPLSDGEISRQVDYIVRNGWSEFCRRQHDSRGQAAAKGCLPGAAQLVLAAQDGCQRPLQPAVQQQRIWLPSRP